MIISANAIVFNQFGQVLLIQRDDTRTLAPPGGACELDEEPPVAAAREVREETGLIIYPVRLTGLYFLPTRPQEYLFLCFRCIQRGGELATSNESSLAGFFETNPLPGPMLAAHREQIEDAYGHQGGPPLWGNHVVSTALQSGSLFLHHVVYPLFGLRRRLSGQPPYEAPPLWRVQSTVILRDRQGATVGHRGGLTGSPELLTTAESTSDAPWDLATDLLRNLIGNQIALSALSGIYLQRGVPLMHFVFTADLPQDAKVSDADLIMIAPSEETGLPEAQLLMIQDARDGQGTCTFGMLP